MSLRLPAHIFHRSPILCLYTERMKVNLKMYNKLDTNLKIILLDHLNNYVGLKLIARMVKFFALLIMLEFPNYFDGLTKLFSDL